MQYPKHANSDDRKCAKALVEAILDKGYAISIFDGEDIALKARRNQTSLDVRKEMGHTGEDSLRVWDIEKKEIVAWFFLIYCNGSEGEPLILICDYSANEIAEDIYRETERRLEA